MRKITIYGNEYDVIAENATKDLFLITREVTENVNHLNMLTDSIKNDLGEQLICRMSDEVRTKTFDSITYTHIMSNFRDQLDRLRDDGYLIEDQLCAVARIEDLDKELKVSKGLIVKSRLYNLAFPNTNETFTICLPANTIICGGDTEPQEYCLYFVEP